MTGEVPDVSLCLLQSVVSEGPGCESSVEQRLLELNRQSAAARSRLLELIEQQRQSSSSVSPSVSPIPPLSGKAAVCVRQGVCVL